MNKSRSSFRVDLGLLRELGERLISRDEVAVVELVKNAYDADATVVKVLLDEDRIEIRDNGSGMDRSEIEEGWLTIGTAVKKKNTKTKRGRRVLGEKGLGRLAVLRLGKRVTIRTKKYGKPCHRILMDWEHARTELDRNEFIPLEQMNLHVTTDDDSHFPKGHGTSVLVQNLNSSWDERSVDRLKVFLARLVEPELPGQDRFAIKLYRGKERLEITPPPFTKKPHYRMVVKVMDDGEYSGELEWNIQDASGREQITGRRFSNLTGPDGETITWKPVTDRGCGGFEFRLHVWDRDATELSGHKQELTQWSGVSLLRDGFRVVQPDIDWLGLNLRRVQNPTMRLSTNQVIGNVLISADRNSCLIDKTDREGVVESEAFAIMKSAIHELMNILERKRHLLRRRKGLSRGVIFSYLDTAPLRKLASKVPREQKREIEEYASTLDKFRDMLEEWILGRDRMATMGLLSARLIHEARGALAKITDNYPLIEKHLAAIPSEMRRSIERMVEGGKLLDRVFSALDPFVKFRMKRTQEVVLKEVVTTLEFLFGPELRKNAIQLINKVPGNIRFRANPTDIYVMLGNFLDNAVYWLAHSECSKKIVEFRARELPGSLTLEVADSGPGVPAEILDQIFVAGFTTKPQGTGLGLSIVRDVAEFYGGRVEATDDDALGGALFRVTLPLKGA